jgi:serine/threonine protein kinase
MFSSPTHLHGLAIPPSTIDVPAADAASLVRPAELAAPTSQGSAFDSQSSVRIAPGTVVANYEVIRQIGAGGMGRVFEVWHPTLQKSFALKLLTEHLEQDRAALERFQSETLAIAQLDHANVVSAIDAGTWHGRPFC